jgi:hypothetical protein
MPDAESGFAGGSSIFPAVVVPIPATFAELENNPDAEAVRLGI